MTRDRNSACIASEAKKWFEKRDKENNWNSYYFDLSDLKIDLKIISDSDKRHFKNLIERLKKKEQIIYCSGTKKYLRDA